MDNIAKRDANTCTHCGLSHSTARGKTFAGDCPSGWLEKEPTPEMAVFKCDEPNHLAEAHPRDARIPTNFCPISFDGSVVDYRGNNGYGELGFDSGEGA